MTKYFYVYVIASKPRGVLYIGVTSDLASRVWEHKKRLVKSFASRYFVDKLVYFEQFTDPYNAITGEKNLKRWKRDWKLKLIEELIPPGKIFMKICFKKQVRSLLSQGRLWVDPSPEFTLHLIPLGTPVNSTILKT